jgi:hypothetical protein
MVLAWVTATWAAPCGLTDLKISSTEPKESLLRGFNIEVFDVCTLSGYMDVFT